MQEGDAQQADAPPNTMRVGVPAGNGHLFESYRWAIRPAFEIDAYDISDRDHCAVTARVSSFEDMLTTRAQSTALTYSRTEQVIAHQGISDLLVEIYLSDEVIAVIEGREIEIRAGDVIVLDLTRPCGIAAGQHEVVVVSLRRSEFERFVSNPDDLHGAVLRARSPLARLLKSHILSLEAESANFDAHEAAALASSTAAMVAHCIGARARDAEHSRAAMGPALFSLVRRHIETGLDNPNLGVDHLVRTFGISRSSLYRMFEPHGGVNAFIRRRRLRRIYGELSSARHRNERIATIAYRWGFVSEVTFSKAFKSAFGISARDLRRFLPRERLQRQGSDGSGPKDDFWRLRTVLDDF